MQNTFCKIDWQTLALRYEREVQKWTQPFRERRRLGQAHPINDFLFVYYQYSSQKLEQWHPGVNKLLVGVEAGTSDFSCKHYSGNEFGDLFCDPAKLKDKERSRLVWIVDLLKQTQHRKPNFSCLGLHEWAMVYHGHEVRHEKTTKLRLPQAEVDAIVESRPLTCTHFDAYRFFSIDAKPLNRVAPEPDVINRPILEQPACIHDLSKYEGYPPIKIETAAGRAEYEQAQRAIAARAKPLREKLWHRIEAVLQM
jgi:hypothetical protein